MVDTEKVWEQLHSGVKAFVRRRVRNDADADDVVQRVFLQVHRGLSSLRDERRLHAWIYGTAKNAIIDHYRAAGRNRESAAGNVLDFDEQGGETAETENAALQELADCLQPLMGQLSAADREALRLVEMEGVSQVAAAERLGVSVSGMKSRVQRARHRLKVIVETCCRVDIDRRGGIVSYAKRSADACDQCDDGCEGEPKIELTEK